MGVRFYFGCASGTERKVLRELEERNVMINYATQNNKPFDTIENLFIDSGGYSFMKGKGEYTTTDRDYLEFIEKHNPRIFALRDYPCEPDVLEEHGRTVRDHQELTIGRHENLLRMLSRYDIDSEPLSVIQGWEFEDYLNHIDMMEERDLLTDYVGIGSICRRGQDDEIRKIIRSVKERLPGKKIHAFGVKGNVLRFPQVVEDLHSADSLAYSSRARNDWDGREDLDFWKNTAYHYLDFKRQIIKMIREAENKEENNQSKIGGFFE